jgi:hypothetical protein
VSDPTKFDPLFTNALAWHLASMLAGPIVKGAEGSAEGRKAAQMAMAYVQQAKQSDANQRDVKPEHITTWMSGR